MSHRNDENLKELFGRFFESEEAEKAVGDLQKVEKILSENAAPEPDEVLLSAIKMKAERTLVNKRARNLKRVFYRAVAVAAVFFAVAAISVRIFEREHSVPEGTFADSAAPVIIWEDDSGSSDESDVAILAAEIKQIEGEILALRLGEESSNGNGYLAELEAELIEIDSDFWKG